MKLFKLFRKSCGLMLIMAAVAGPAFAQCSDPSMQAPEIDPGSLVGALSMLTGGFLMIVDRVRGR